MTIEYTQTASQDSLLATESVRVEIPELLNIKQVRDYLTVVKELFETKSE